MTEKEFWDEKGHCINNIFDDDPCFGVGAAYGAGYTDVKQGNWAYEAVNAMSERGIIIGYPNGSFLPNNTVTYGEFIKMALIAGTGEDAGNAAAGHWALNYYNKALELKYYTEYDIDKSQLGDKITRADMALIISSILGDVKIDNYDKIQEGIEDITYQTPHEYDITKAYACGILTGYSDKTFRPDKNPVPGRICNGNLPAGGREQEGAAGGGGRDSNPYHRRKTAG